MISSIVPACSHTIDNDQVHTYVVATRPDTLPPDRLSCMSCTSCTSPRAAVDTAAEPGCEGGGLQHPLRKVVPSSKSLSDSGETVWIKQSGPAVRSAIKKLTAENPQVALDRPLEDGGKFMEIHCHINYWGAHLG